MDSSIKFLKNKHVITAFLVAPLLAIGAWFAVDLVVSETPHPAVEGQSYRLSAKSNCRYTSGECDLVNADFSSRLVVVQNGDNHVLQLRSSHSLEAVKVGFRDAQSEFSMDEVRPITMLSTKEDMKSWAVEMPLSVSENTELVLALSASGSHYYAETTMVFSEYQTIFKKDYRKK